MPDLDLKQSFDTLEKKVTDDSDSSNSIKFNDQTRGKIGKIFVWGFFVAIFGSILVTIGYNILFYYITQDTELFIKLDSLLTLVGSIIGAPLGFVMGYYFKSDKD
ncbi:MAG: hypothetical protein WAZ12_00725 [Candidatus Absconditicoccaceae bacterium]